MTPRRMRQLAAGLRMLTLAAVLAVGVSSGAAIVHAQDDAATAQPAADAAVPDANETEETVSFLKLLGLGGYYFMIPLGACSLLAFAISIDRILALRSGRIVAPGFEDGVKQAIGSPATDIDAARQYCDANDCVLARVLHAGLRKHSRGEEAVETAIEDAGANEISRLRTHFRLLYGVTAVTPMIGLLGTVWGMIRAFQVASSQGLGQAEKLAEGIYIALVTTFAGLTIAIPFLIIYMFLQSRVEQVVSRLNDASITFLEHVFGEHITDHPIRSDPRDHTHHAHSQGKAAAKGDDAPAASPAVNTGVTQAGG